MAIRVMRAAAEMDIRAVAIYSKEDHLALHRFKADGSYLVGEGRKHQRVADLRGQPPSSDVSPRTGWIWKHNNGVETNKKSMVPHFRNLELLSKSWTEMSVSVSEQFSPQYRRLAMKHKQYSVEQIVAALKQGCPQETDFYVR